MLILFNVAQDASTILRVAESRQDIGVHRCPGHLQIVLQRSGPELSLLYHLR